MPVVVDDQNIFIPPTLAESLHHGALIPSRIRRTPRLVPLERQWDRSLPARAGRARSRDRLAGLLGAVA